MTTHTIGLVGCGHISVTHLKAWKKLTNCEVRGVFDLNQELAAKRAQEFAVPKIYTDLNELIADCDVLDVCTPPQTHAKIAQQIIAAGKNLVIEKPLVTNVADWEMLLAALETSPSKIAIVHNLKYSAGIQQAKKWVDAGKIGRIISIQNEFLTSPNHDRMLVGNSHWSHRLPGGRWFETMPHQLYLTHYFGGNLKFTSVSSLHTNAATPGAPADEVLVTLKNEHSTATIHFSSNCEQNQRTLVLQGTEGKITVDLLSSYAALSTQRDSKSSRAIGGKIALDAGQLVLTWLPNRAQYALNQIQGETPHAAIIRTFARYLDGQGEAPTPLDEIDYVVRNGDLIGRAIDESVKCPA